jgi:hypothetical protein
MAVMEVLEARHVIACNLAEPATVEGTGRSSDMDRRLAEPPSWRLASNPRSTD